MNSEQLAYLNLYITTALLEARVKEANRRRKQEDEFAEAIGWGVIGSIGAAVVLFLSYSLTTAAILAVH